MRRPSRVAPSRHARRPKATAKAQRAKQAVVKSPKYNSPPRFSDTPERIEKDQTDTSFLPNTPLASQDESKQPIKDNVSKNVFDFSSSTAAVRAYQAKLLQISQANMQFAFEFAQRIATIRSPVEFLKVSEELTRKRVAMFQKHSKDLSELIAKPR